MTISARNRNLFKQLALFAAVVGPGIITGSVDNDAGGITTYSVAGAVYGYGLLWTLIPSFVVLFVVQEMNLRMGIVTGKGLADLIRENAGVKVTFFIFIGQLFADIGNTMTEFAGIAGSMDIFGVSKYLSVPIGLILVWALVVKGRYRLIERVFLILSAFLLVYIVSAIMGKPHWGEIGHAIVRPSMKMDAASVSMVIGIVGTTIAPWMQFYMQSAVIEKGLTVDDYRLSIWDVLLGTIATIAVAFFIITACAATLHEKGVTINDARDAAAALRPLAGGLSSSIFALGLLVASVFSAAILPISTAFYVCEAFGFEAGVDKRWEEAREFYILFTSIIVVGAAIVLIPHAPLIAITLWSQVANGILLPVVLVSMMLLINNKNLMGDRSNGPTANVVGWGTVVVLVGLSLVLVILSVVT